jgi:hypothetical protein
MTTLFYTGGQPFGGGLREAAGPRSTSHTSTQGRLIWPTASQTTTRPLRPMRRQRTFSYRIWNGGAWFSPRGKREIKWRTVFYLERASHSVDVFHEHCRCPKNVKMCYRNPNAALGAHLICLKS